MLSKLRRAPLSGETLGARHYRLHLVRDLTFEVIPLKSLDAAIEALPAGSRVSVTASPVKGQDATCEITERLMELGHEAIPHVSARMVTDRARVSELASWFRSAGVSTMFLVGGDVESPGAYSDAASFLRDLLECDHGLSTIGVTAYPHGHPLIAEEVLHEALHTKQALLAEAGVEGYCSTQMCFDPARIEGWLRGERAAGLTLPVHLGISGVVDRAKLLTMGARLGVGPSLRYLRKNRAAIMKLMTSPNYDPDHILMALSPSLDDLGVTGLHVFTFNQVATTVTWQSSHHG
ncbi:MAG: 5,10-methylenetetrahydrofolate reductase [Acidimicrobiaceae bacterium]|nr:5,10-methylenetetrahydrofolate reductase [Acidimicrobiaceae bacterium]MYA86689.1 5,10-methylenetetrahydrofolate reductase [Acidimicrobiaceae bacterium]